MDEYATAARDLLEASGIKVTLCLSNDSEVADPAVLLNKLIAGEFELLYFTGHGQYNPNTPSESFLALGPPGDLKQLTARTLGGVVSDSRLIFVVLGACQGMQGDAVTSPIGPGEELGIVDAFVREGIPAAIGMRWDVRTDTVEELTKQFFERFKAEDSIEDALHRAKRHLVDIGKPDWINPILTKRHGVL